MKIVQSALYTCTLYNSFKKFLEIKYNSHPIQLLFLTNLDTWALMQKLLCGLDGVDPWLQQHGSNSRKFEPSTTLLVGDLEAMQADLHPRTAGKVWAVACAWDHHDCPCSQLPGSHHSAGPQWVPNGWMDECACISGSECSFNICLCLLFCQLMATDLVSWKGQETAGSLVWMSPVATWEQFRLYHPQLFGPPTSQAGPWLFTT